MYCSIKKYKAFIQTDYEISSSEATWSWSSSSLIISQDSFSYQTWARFETVGAKPALFGCHFIYWKEKETHIHFGCYLYQRFINNCVNESLFEMLNIHIWTNCDTFLCKETMCASHVNGKGDRGYERGIQVVLNNRKNWFFKCSGFG